MNSFSNTVRKSLCMLILLCTGFMNVPSTPATGTTAMAHTQPIAHTHA